MKKIKKALLLVTSASALVVASVWGTMAYLTSTDEVENTFTVGNVEIQLDEAVVDENGIAVVPAKRTEDGNKYHLLPGMEYDKDPRVTVKEGSEESYVRMKMTVHNASAVQTIINNHLGAGSDFSDLLVGWDDQTWIYEKFTADNAADTITFEFRYYTPVDGYDMPEEGTEEAMNVALAPLFTKLIVPGGTSNDELKALEDGGFKIDIVAHAIQVASFANEDAAWGAFDNQMKN